MMKKVLYGVALTLLAGASVGTLQSCKDDVQDLKTQTSFDLLQLKNELKGDLKKLEDKLSDLENKVNGKVDLTTVTQLLEEYAKKTWVLEQINTLQESITNNANAITNLTEKLNGHIQIAEERYEALTAEDARLLGLIEGALESIDEIKGKLDNYALKSEFEALKTVVEGHTTKLDNLEGRVAANEAAIETINQTLDQLTNSLDELTSKVDGIDEKFTGEIATINGKLNVIDGKFQDLDIRLNGIDIRLDGFDDSIAGLNSAVEGLNNALNGLTIRVSTLEGDLQLTKENVEELKQKVYFLSQELSRLRSDLANLASNVNLISENLDALVQRVANVELSLNALSSRMDNMVTSILVQATDSPVFGNFSLPIGVKSSVLFNWYGFKKSMLEQFPSLENTFDGAGPEAPELTDFPGMVTPITIADGFMGDVNLGTVYLTVNPIGHVFDDENFSLETTAGNPIPSLKMHVTKSNDELTFGYSRAPQVINGNGFYAAEVVIDGDNAQNQEALNKGINAVNITIDENLKAAAKDLFKDRSKRNAVDLLKAVYGQLNGKFPAYAVRYNWDNGKYSVISNYDLAVAAAKPLSYDFSFKTSKRLKHIGHINNFIEELKKNGNLHFDFSDQKLNLGEFSITINKIEITAPNEIEEPDIVIDFGTIDVIDLQGNIIGSVTPEPYHVTEITDIVADINANVIGSIKDMKGKIDNWSGEVETEINSKVTEMLSTVEEKVNEMMKNISGQINNKVDNLITDFGNKAQPWFDRLNRLADLYDRVADKINNVLEDPNHYLQVAMFYNQVGSGVGMLSNVKSDPTPFVGNNGNIGLYASSYTGEILAPAFKKYVACTNVYQKVKENGKTVIKDAPNAATLRNNVNNAAKNFNEVVDGYTIRYAIPASAVEKDYIYEISYQGLDYHGYTSTQKFYITVNK